MREKKLFILDAMGLIYRAYYALSRNPQSNSKGLNTSAILGFANTILDVLKKEKPSHICVAFDSSTPTIRHQEYTEYKANREKMPEGISLSLPYIKQLLDCLRIEKIKKDGFEADDIVGSLAKRAEREGFEVYMLTSDKDYCQLVSDHIYMYKPPYRGDGFEVLGKKEVCEKYGIDHPDRIRDILGLAGDRSDNIPGVPGVGMVTAQKLISNYGSIEDILENIENIGPKSLQSKLKENADKAILSKKLASIILDVDLEISLDDCVLKPPKTQELIDLLSFLEMKQFLKRYIDFSSAKWGGEAAEAAANDNETQVATVHASAEGIVAAAADGISLKTVADTTAAAFLQTTPAAQEEICEGLFASLPQTNAAKTELGTHYKTIDELKEVFEKGYGTKDMAFAICEAEGETASSQPITPSVAAHGSAHRPTSFWAFSNTNGEFIYYSPQPKYSEVEKSFINQYICQRTTPWICYNSKQIWHILKRNDADVATLQNLCQCRDIMLSHYVLNPELSHELHKIAFSTSRNQIDKEDVANFISIWQDLEKELRESNSWNLYENIEQKLSFVLAQMEDYGVAIDTAKLEELSQDLDLKIQTLSEEIYSLAGKTFNIASPKQLGEVLYIDLGLQAKPKRTKTKQLSTSEESLKSIIDKHEIVPLVLQYRSLTKLKSTYIDSLPKLINPQTNRIHTTYNQVVVATGRLSSQDPNLQNIPIRTPLGREIRKAFVAQTKENCILAADYSQIELRIIAALSGDESMLQDFERHKDVHSSTAAKIYNIDIDEVSPEQRRSAKAVNFGIIYGMTAFGLSERLSITRKEASELIQRYYEQYPRLRQYIDECVEEARQKGYVETICKRRRYLPDITSANAIIRNYDERNAINAPIQGSSADMIKIAMINISEEIKVKGLKAKMIMQVHDELIFELPKTEIETLSQIVEEKMKSAIEIGVPIEVDMHWAANWADAH